MPTEVSLMEMLDARERRVQRQRVLLEQYHRPLICFTMNICGPAKVCSSRRVHTVAQLQEKTAAILTDTLTALDAAAAAQQAVRAILYEVATTPKPGLVDRCNSGSHTDMNFFTFMDSAASLYPYFEACARAGQASADRPAPETFAALRPLGCEAEGEMLDATGGVNTHKGAIFSIGIACAALAALDDSFRAERLSPGGSADLLALTYLLYFFKTEDNGHV